MNHAKEKSQLEVSPFFSAMKVVPFLQHGETRSFPESAPKWLEIRGAPDATALPVIPFGSVRRLVEEG